LQSSQPFNVDSSHSNQAVGSPLSNSIYKVINLVGLIALCLGIYGGNKQAGTDSTDYTHVNNDSKIAVVLFTGIFIVSFVMFLVLATRLSIVPHGEKRLMVAVGLSWPFLTVRYIYALVADFGQNKNFNSYFGNPTIYLIMAVLTECVVIVICESIGLTLHKAHKGEPVSTSDVDMNETDTNGEEPGLGYREERVPLSNGDGNGVANLPRMLPKKRHPKGPISWLIYQAKDAFQSRD
jgi:hypothetical protein